MKRKFFTKYYNNMRTGFTVLGLVCVVHSLYALFNLESVQTLRRNGSEIKGKEEVFIHLTFLLVGVIFLILRFRFMKYSKSGCDEFESSAPTKAKVENTDNEDE